MRQVMGAAWIRLLDIDLFTKLPKDNRENRLFPGHNFGHSHHAQFYFSLKGSKSNLLAIEVNSDGVNDLSFVHVRVGGDENDRSPERSLFLIIKSFEPDFCFHSGLD